MKKILVFLIVALSAVNCQADDQGDVALALFLELHDEFAQRLHYSVALDVCGYKGISEKVCPSTRELNESILKKIKATQNKNDKNGQFFKKSIAARITCNSRLY